MLAAVAGDFADDALKVAGDDADGLALGEFLFVRGDEDDVILFGGADDTEAFYLMIGDDEGFLRCFAADVEMAVVEAEEGEVHVVVDVGLELVFSGVGEEDVGKTGFLHFSALSVDEPDGGYCGIVCLDLLIYKVVVGFLLASVGCAKGIPTGDGLRSTKNWKCSG